MASAPDVITYVGVPLAVLGVMPILYTCIKALYTLRSIRLALQKIGLDATTRGSLMSGVIEVELPRFSVTPLDREDLEYWGLSPTTSTLNGGSWTVFIWNRIITGRCIYRLQYSDDLQVPKAEIDFGELIDFLLDRGAVPSAQGLHLLRGSGLWTPAGTNVLLSPDTTESVLRVSTPDDSDGVLSFKVQWRKAWDCRNNTSLPPSWMRLEGPQSKPEQSKVQETPEFGKGDAVLEEKVAEDQMGKRGTSIRFHLDLKEEGYIIDSATWEHNHEPLDMTLHIPHIQDESARFWVLSAAVALGELRGIALWTTPVPESIKLLANKDSVLYGALVLADIGDDKDARARRKMKIMGKSFSGETEKARKAREAEELHQFHHSFQVNTAERRHQDLQRGNEALSFTSLLSTVSVAQAALQYLSSTVDLNSCCDDVPGAAERILFLAMQSRKETQRICKFLDRWKRWTDRAEMKDEDFKTIKQDKDGFCRAACVMGLFAIASTKQESSISSDILECTRRWRKVRLG
ncbi:hypothetical protein MMC20_003461 [Loxospora ochrophaea]|nr:hypothetical protein [Loxospora ochrophaea]